MKRSMLIIAAFGVALLGFTPAALANAADAIGTWKDLENQATKQIYSCEGGICVKVIIPGRRLPWNGPSRLDRD